MTSMLIELSSVFSLEAWEKDEEGDPDESDRLYDIADELHEMAKKKELDDVRRSLS